MRPEGVSTVFFVSWDMIISSRRELKLGPLGVSHDGREP
jgi:hypothetical protein